MPADDKLDELDEFGEVEEPELGELERLEKLEFNEDAGDIKLALTLFTNPGIFGKHKKNHKTIKNNHTKIYNQTIQ